MTITERLNRVTELANEKDYDNCLEQLNSLWEDYKKGVKFSEDDETYLTIITDNIYADYEGD